MMEHQSIAVEEMSQAGQARRTAAVLAERLGLDTEESGRLGLVVSEAATNLVKHARGGAIVLGPSLEDEARSVEVLAMDHGPGIGDLDRALRDGYSTCGGMGSGLGAIRRNASAFDLYSSESGTILFARVGGRPSPAPARRGAALAALEVGALCIPCPGETVSGDAWAVTGTGARALVLVADGLGHGQDAHEASALAVEVFAEHADEAPADLIERLHGALHSTRGAAAAVLELDRAERVARIAGIGNISATVLADGGQRSMVSHHGVLGHTLRHVREFVYPWPPRSLVVLHTDGIGTHWDLARYPGLARRHPTLIAAALYRDFRRQRDDATVVVLREAV
jgi:anti-sigma regulatory factor (Ser/Thr protein kinase)